MAAPEQLEDFLQEQGQVTKRYGAQLHREIEEQRQEERLIIDNDSSFCPLSRYEGKVISTSGLEQLLHTKADDENVLKMILCMNNTLAILPPRSGKSLRIRRYLRDLKQIGADGVDGYAMSTDVRGVGKGLFVLKAPKTSKTDLLHEYFIGAYGTNNLRNEIPTFSYIFGTLACSPPYIDNLAYLGDGYPSNPKDDRRALTYCQNDLDANQVNYVLYENIKGISLKDFVIQGCSFKEYLSIIAQLAFGLNLGYMMCGFTHNDLHDENVMIVTLDHDITIKLSFPDGQAKYLRTNVIAKIIDYGRSHIMYNGDHFGYDIPEVGVYPERAFPMYDLYKVVMFSLQSAAFGKRGPGNKNNIPDIELASQMVNPEVFENGKTLIRFWYPDIPLMAIPGRVAEMVRSATGYLTDIYDTYYTLPDNTGFLNSSPINLFTTFEPLFTEVLGNSLSQVSTGEIYGCSNRGDCQSIEQAVENYTSNESEMLSDPYIFYDMYLRNPTQSLVDQCQMFVNGYIDELQSDNASLLSELDILIPNIQIMSIDDDIPLDLYRRFIDRSVRAVDLQTNINCNNDVLDVIYRVYPESVSQRPYTDKSYENILNQIILRIKSDVAYIKTLDPRSLGQEGAWLFMKMPSLIAAIAQFKV